MTQLTLAVGSAGKFAGLVVSALAARGVAVRGLVQNAYQRDGVEQRGAAEVAIGDLTESGSIDDALKGVTSVFYIAPAFMPNEADVGIAMVEAAKRAGVRRLVFSSVIHPVLSALSNHSAKAPVEEAILDSGLEFAFLHPALYFQNFAQAWPAIVETSTVSEPWSNETRFSRVDYRDVAEVAAIALTEDRLLNGTFELCADGALNRHDVAALIGNVLDRDIGAAAIDPTTLGDEAKPMLPMFAHYDRAGLLGCSLTLRAILEREPRSLRSYFEELAKGS